MKQTVTINRKTSDEPKAKITQIGTFDKTTDTLHDFCFEYVGEERGAGSRYVRGADNVYVLELVCGWTVEELKELAVKNQSERKS